MEADIHHGPLRVDLSRSAASGLAPVSDLPEAVLAHIGMLARKRPFAACGNLALILACLTAAQGVQDVIRVSSPSGG